MTPEQLKELLQRGELLEVEFKGEERERLPDDELVEAVVCLANRSSSTPAWLLVGAEDDRRVTGAQLRHESGRTDPQRVAALIANRTRPSLSVRVFLIPWENEEILAIEVPTFPAPVATTAGKYLHRVLGGDGRSACVPMFFHEMQARQADRGILDYSALPVPEAWWEDLDPLEFERFRRSIRSRGGFEHPLAGLAVDHQRSHVSDPKSRKRGEGCAQSFGRVWPCGSPRRTQRPHLALIRRHVPPPG